VINQLLTQQAKDTREPAVDVCDVGLIKLNVPIYLQDTFLGVVSCCGSLPMGGEVEEFLIQRTTSLTDQAMRELSHTIKTIGQDQINDWIKIIQQKLGSLLINR
jgi:ligand-binding sensor protein